MIHTHINSPNSPKHVAEFMCMDDLRFYINCVHLLAYMDDYGGTKSLEEPRHRWENITVDLIEKK